MTALPDIAHLLDLTGKVAIVTGAASGMGAETARYFAGAGASVVAADWNSAGAETIAAELKAAGATALAVTVDISDEASVIGMMDQVKAHFGRLDSLVNNAGIQDRAMLADMSVECWDRIQAVNLRGTFLCLREAAKIMRTDGGGTIVNISSTGSIHPTRNAAFEFASAGIRVNAVLPGGVITEGGMKSTGTIPSGRSIQPPPIGRIGQPKDIAALVLFLAGPASTYITGQSFIADGGFLLG
jgi:NAD(P)-dependent dehydrogenase (short-subunit alcohol dehydrogenase family)